MEQHEQKTDYMCQMCGLVMESQTELDNHYCDRMLRSDALKTVTGQSAKLLYEAYLKVQNRSYPGDFLFITSRYFTSLLKFADYVKRIKLPKPFYFIEWAMKRNWPPTLWMNGKVYMEYMDHMDHQPPFEALAESIKWMDNYCEDRGVDIGQFFNVIVNYDLVEAVQSRSVTAWALVFCPEFANYMKSGNLSTEQKMIIEVNLNINRVNKVLDSDPELVDAIKTTLKSIGLRS